MSEEDLLRRCLHYTMRRYINGKLDESKPCLHWECVARNRAADRIEELEAVLREIRDAPVGALRTATVREVARRALDGGR